MTKAEVVRALKEKAGLATLAQAEKTFESLFGLIVGALKKDDEITIHGFGRFKVVKRAARKGRNPQTGKEIQIPASKSVRFTVGKAFKEQMR